ncbi:citramalate synthase [Conexibacter sp. DBS9H8]|uniref:citramalate synthase n=1 Tax=Conexibacter sp. DBS9H8 TaxID=2937801 RepID=UPI00200C4E3E|nr:citramalate synthase [Conexibacter sp. DBS9H8]
MTRIELYDTTLRDGMQGEGMSLSAHEKLRVAHTLDELGIDVIEAGFPSSNPKELELFGLLSAERFDHAQVAAFGMTHRKDLSAAEDPALAVLADCFAPIATIVGKTWSLHLEKVVKVSPAENLAMIADSVAFLVSAGKRVIYDAEHFFDGFCADREYALACLMAAARAGADTVVCCDTNGGSLPEQIAEAIAAVRATLPPAVAVGIHCHDDAGLGVANTLAAVTAGARQVQGTQNGYGERCGNANLTTAVANLQLKLGYACVRPDQLAQLTAASGFLNELLNLAPNPDQPYVGRNAFAHKGGMHVAGIAADPATFEHIDPVLVGNSRDVLVSELSGRGTILAHAERAGISLEDNVAARVLEDVKEREHRGYHYEAADGSLELLLRKATGDYEPLFVLESWRVIVEKRAEDRVATEATVKLWAPPGPDAVRYVQTAEGNGPVNALDAALRGALAAIYPDLAGIELANFKVRILDGNKGTEAVTRVLLDSTGEDGREWGAVGVSANVIEASWEALLDSLEYGMQTASTHAARGARLAGREP